MGAVTVQSSNGVKLIPYLLYSNRGAGWMRVWIPKTIINIIIQRVEGGEPWL
jgi:hypothetical protein